MTRSGFSEPLNIHLFFILIIVISCDSSLIGDTGGLPFSDMGGGGLNLLSICFSYSQVPFSKSKIQYTYYRPNIFINESLFFMIYFPTSSSIVSSQVRTQGEQGVDRIAFFAECIPIKPSLIWSNGEMILECLCDHQIGMHN